MNAINEFQFACSKNDLDRAKQLLSDNPTVDVSADNNFLFHAACLANHLELAQWLSTLTTIQVDVFMDATINSACEHGHIDLLRWLG